MNTLLLTSAWQMTGYRSRIFRTKQSLTDSASIVLSTKSGIKSYFLADNKTGCRFLTVDAYAAAIPFYLKQHFVPLTSEDDCFVPLCLEHKRKQIKK